MEADRRCRCGVEHRLPGQEGQAILLLLMVAISMLFFFSLMYHAGAIIVLKMRLQNTADVTAMAAATQQAHGLQTISRLNKEIVDKVVEANEDVFGSDLTFPSNPAAQAYITDEYLARIEQLASQIEGVQREAPARVLAAATSVARQNLAQAQMVWHSPRLRDPRLGEVLVKLKHRKDAEFHYVVKEPGAEKAKHRHFKAPTYFDGKTNDVVYSAVQVRLDGLRLGDTLFQSHIDNLAAYSVAKPWGGRIGGFESILPNAVIMRWEELLPWVVTLYLRRWNGPQALLEHDPLDYDVWLVRVSDPRLRPAPVGIPDQARFLH
jgi:hypothetical protein